MWYEILPSFGIVVFAMALPHGASYLLNRAIVGNHFRRSTLDKHERMQYMRDLRLSGDPYKVKGLEAIPDN